MIVKCPNCKKLLEVAEIKLGKKDVCEHCEQIFLVDESVIYHERKPMPPEESEKRSTTETASKKETQEPKPKARKKTFSIGRIIIGVIVIIIGIFVALWIVGSINKGIKEAGGEGIIPRQTYPIVNKSFKLSAGEYWYIEFNSVKGARLVGSVSVPDYDVNVWLIEGHRELKAFKNSDEFYYVSAGSAKKINNFSINCLLDDGTYYLVIDNTYSILNAKRPTVNLSIEY